MSGLISADIRATAAAALDSLMAPQENGGLGKHCKLLFDPKRTKCPNCYWDQQNQRSANHYRPGGPQPFPDGSLCPVCLGKGVIEQEVSQDIVMLCNFNPRTWLVLPGLDPSTINLQIPGGAVQTKGWMTDMEKVLQSRRMILDFPNQGIHRYLYELAGEPVSPGNIVQGKYFVALWRRTAS